MTMLKLSFFTGLKCSRLSSKQLQLQTKWLYSVHPCTWFNCWTCELVLLVASTHDWNRLNTLELLDMFIHTSKTSKGPWALKGSASPGFFRSNIFLQWNHLQRQQPLNCNHTMYEEALYIPRVQYIIYIIELYSIRLYHLLYYIVCIVHMCIENYRHVYCQNTNCLESLTSENIWKVVSLCGFAPCNSICQTFQALEPSFQWHLPISLLPKDHQKHSQQLWPYV